MTTVTRYLICVAVLLAFSTTGCDAVNDLLGGRPSASVERVGFSEVGTGAMTMTFDLRIDNPYAVPLPLVDLAYGLNSRGNTVLEGTAPVAGSVPARGSRTITLPARVVYADALRVLSGVKLGDVVPYEAMMNLSVDAPAAGRLSLPISKKGEMPIPAPPAVSVNRITWDELSINRAAGTVELGITNPNSFKVDLSGLDYTLDLAGTRVANSSISRAVSFAAEGGTGTLSIPLELNPRELGLAAFRMLSGRGADYRLGGAMKLGTPFGPMTLPLDKRGQTVFGR